MKKTLTSAVAISAIATAFAGYAAAQDGDTDDARKLGTVTVTAQRTEESLQDVPIAVTALSAVQLEDKQIADVLDLQFQVPNINLATNTGTASAARIFLRGVGEDESRGAVDQAVGIYVDGIYIGRSVGSLFDLVDLEQIEVLRGPQGTLYGRNTIGGAIKLTSVRPQFETGGDVRVTIGDNGRQDLRATGNVALGDRTAFRLTGLMRERDGFWTLTPNGGNAGQGKEVGKLDMQSFRASFLHEFDNDWSIYITADNTLDLSDPIPDTAAPPNDVDNNLFTIEPLAGVTCPPGNGGFTALGCFTNYDQRLESQGVSATIEGKIGTFDFTSLTGFRQLEDNLSTRIGFPYIQETDQDQFSQEFTLASNNEGAFNYVVGAYYWEEDLQLDTTFVFPFTLSSSTESLALFGQGTLEVSDQLSVTGGLRYTDESKDFSGENLAFGLTRDDTANFENLSYTIGTDYRFNDSVLGYAKFSTGFKSGGWSPDAFSGTSIFLPVREETLDSFEIGFKSDFANNTVRLNGAYFINDYSDLQIGATVPGLGFTRFNVEGTEIDGFELEAVWQLTENFQVNGNVGVLDAKYTDLSLASAGGLTNNGATPACGGVVTIACAKTLNLKNAPEYKASIGALYAVPMQGGELIFSGDVNFEDDSWSLVANSPAHALIDVPTLYNARVKFQSDYGWSLAVWGKNVSDEEYYRASSANSFTAYASEPSTFGIDVGYTF